MDHPFYLFNNWILIRYVIDCASRRGMAWKSACCSDFAPKFCIHVDLGSTLAAYHAGLWIYSNRFHHGSYHPGTSPWIFRYFMGSICLPLWAGPWGVGSLQLGELFLASSVEKKFASIWNIQLTYTCLRRWVGRFAVTTFQWALRKTRTLVHRLGRAWRTNRRRPNSSITAKPHAELVAVY